MNILTYVFSSLVAFEALFIMTLEIFFIKSKIAQRSFELDAEFLEDKRVQVMFANQGLYNGFLGVGLLVSLYLFPQDFRQMSSILFVSFVLAAGIFGGLTSSRKIIVKQGLPALIALLLLIFIGL